MVFFFFGKKNCYETCKNENYPKPGKMLRYFVFFFFFSCVILFVDFRNQNISHQQPNKKATIYS